MRSMLFVPGDSERKLAKGLESGADALIVDLEDSVSAGAKATARQMVKEFLLSCKGGPGPRLYVRVNDLSTGLTDADLDAAMEAAPDGIMLPKCEGGHDFGRLSTALRVREAEFGLEDGSTKILPIITETAAAVLAAASYRASDPRLAALTWGAEDLSAAIGASATRGDDEQYTDVFGLARAMTLLAASAAEVAAIDTVYPDFRDLDGFRAECLRAERDGFTGCMAIHPAQVPVINEVFTPSPEAVAEALTIVEAFAAEGDPGVVGIDGKMYDRPHLKRAERLLARATGFTG